MEDVKEYNNAAMANWCDRLTTEGARLVVAIGIKLKEDGNGGVMMITPDDTDQGMIASILEDIAKEIRSKLN